MCRYWVGSHEFSCGGKVRRFPSICLDCCRDSKGLFEKPFTFHTHLIVRERIPQCGAIVLLLKFKIKAKP